MRRAVVSLCLAAATLGVVVSGVQAQQSSAARPRATAGPTRAPQVPARFGLGRAATADEIRRLDIDVMPNGQGLPAGRGTVAEGAATYAAKCASCHGKSGEGAAFDRLVGTDAGDNFAFGREPGLVRAIGNYWPYASTLFDYTARSMPFMQPGSLSASEVYGLVAYLLAENKIVGADAVMDKTTLPKVVMPAHGRFVRDNRTGGKVVK